MAEQAGRPIRPADGSLPADLETRLDEHFSDITLRLVRLETRLSEWSSDQHLLLSQVLRGSSASNLCSENGQDQPKLPAALCVKADMERPMIHAASLDLQAVAPVWKETDPPTSEEALSNADGIPITPPPDPADQDAVSKSETDADISARPSRKSRVSVIERDDIIKHFTGTGPAPTGGGGGSKRLTGSNSSNKFYYQQARRDSVGHQASPLVRFVHHPWFDYFFGSIILLNSLFIGVQTSLHGNEPGFLHTTEFIFIGIFTFENLIRLVALKKQFWIGHEWNWNIFDLALVIFSLIDLILGAAVHPDDTSNSAAAEGPSAGDGITKILHVIHMARIIRIIRILRFLMELRVLVNLIVRTMKSLFWLLILISLELYVFSVIFTQAATDFLSSSSASRDTATADAMRNLYGSIQGSALTLFQVVTGGVLWADVLNVLYNCNIVFAGLFLIYISFTVFSVLNVITGVFVDGAIQRSSQERDVRLEKEREQKEMYVSMLLDLLEEIDTEGEGVITRGALQAAFADERVQHYFAALDINVADSNYLFDMLDLDQSGEVDMHEFVTGCLRLKGSAKSIEIHTLMFEVKLMMNKVEHLMERSQPEGRPNGKSDLRIQQSESRHRL